jgi:hypothetical protein
MFRSICLRVPKLQLNRTTVLRKSVVVGVASTGFILHSRRNVAYCDYVGFQDPSFPAELTFPVAGDSPIIPKAERTWIDWFKLVWNSVTWSSSLVLRGLELLTIYFPVALTSPILLLQNTYYSNIWWHVFRYCIRVAGPCHIKFAQWAATRPDLFPQYVCDCFAELQSSMDYDLVTLQDLKTVLAYEYGENWETYIQLKLIPKPTMISRKNQHQSFYPAGGLRSLSHLPLPGEEDEDEHWAPAIAGGGCIAQVFQAKALIPEYPVLRQKDENPHVEKHVFVWKDVVLKVTHPNIKQIILADLELARIVLNCMEYLLPNLKNVSLVDSFEEFYPIMLNQVNMKIEAKNVLKFRRNFHNKNHYNVSQDVDRLLGLSIEGEGMYHYGTINQQKDNDPFEEEMGGEEGFRSQLKKFIFKFLQKSVKLLFRIKPVEQFMSDESTDDIYSVFFPEPVLTLTTENILMETFEKGILLRDYIEYCSEREKKLIGKYGLNSILKMAFLDNFVHAGKYFYR